MFSFERELSFMERSSHVSKICLKISASAPNRTSANASNFYNSPEQLCRLICESMNFIYREVAIAHFLPKKTTYIKNTFRLRSVFPIENLHIRFRIFNPILCAYFLSINFFNNKIFGCKYFGYQLM